MFKNYRCIGILGGTFNPVHMGHISMAKAAKENYPGIEKIIFLPNNIPGYKDGSQIADENHRLAMLKEGIKGLPWALVSDMEIKRGGITYTYDTLDTIKNLNPDIVIYFIIGSDSLVSFNKWFRYKDVLKKCILLVGSRDNNREEMYRAGDRLMQECNYAKIEYLDLKEFPVASTDIRESIKKGNNPGDLLPPGVMKYIIENKLYM
mgnify:CR=1 FL=1